VVLRPDFLYLISDIGTKTPGVRYSSSTIDSF